MMKSTQSGDIDKLSPLMINLVPKKYLDYHSDSKLSENLLNNAKRLTTSPDLFWTDLGMIAGTKGYKGEKKKYGWLVDEVRETRKEQFKKQKAKDRRNWGMDFLGEAVPDDRFCDDIPIVYDNIEQVPFICKCRAE